MLDDVGADSLVTERRKRKTDKDILAECKSLELLKHQLLLIVIPSQFILAEHRYQSLVATSFSTESPISQVLIIESARRVEQYLVLP